MAKACRAQGRYLEELVADRDPFWPAQVTILGAIVLYVALPEKLTLGPRWLLPSLQGLRARQPREPRLAHPPHPLLAQGRKAGGHQLILSGVLLWATNVLLFAVWYWEIDRGGPVARTLEEHPRADLLFPQMSDPQLEQAPLAPALHRLLVHIVHQRDGLQPHGHDAPHAHGEDADARPVGGRTGDHRLVVARAVNILSCRKPLDWGFPPGRAGDALSEQVATAARGA